jgi:hypothetical protein
MREIVSVIASVNQSFLTRNSACYLKKTYFSQQLAKKLVLLGLIERIQSTESKHIVLTFKPLSTVISKGSLLSIKVCSRSSQAIYLSAYSLRSLVFQSRRKLFILSIPHKGGLALHDYCIERGIGGLLLGVITPRV